MNNTEIRRPVIGITMERPRGQRAELCVQALLHKAIYEECRPLIVGDANVIEKSGCAAGPSELTVHRVDQRGAGAFTWGIIDVYHLNLVDWRGLNTEKCPRCAGARRLSACGKSLNWHWTTRWMPPAPTL